MIALPFLDMLRFKNTEEKKQRSLQQGHAYFQAGKYQEALIALKNVLQLEPTLAQAHYYLGRTYLRMGLFVDAYAALDQSGAGST
jgi:Flp pilus assembly protein TadD